MIRQILIATLVLCIAGPPALAGDLSLLRQSGVVALMRHATAPGTGDPYEFKIGDCSTQRNLSDAGRDEARQAGQRLRKAGISFSIVGSSQWCRTRETARLLNVGAVKDMPELNSFFADPSNAEEQTRLTLARIADMPLDAPAMLVTHQVNITALTGVIPQQGEIVVARPNDHGTLDVVGKIPPP
ncbi:histidine phosphatase family protein [Zhengella mangrovi]|uniref:Histidine phosphatase family protein n=1 Tax=Zhengella mangrovi TaxID=1982044 RepID=A0A2G1QTP9_9HYPH|nr:histidine phosphatase family protein [Zhengella mangrovi]PHP68872.1 histidine phosphatase family protein [Zhengella mangrovi]